MVMFVIWLPFVQLQPHDLSVIKQQNQKHCLHPVTNHPKLACSKAQPAPEHSRKEQANRTEKERRTYAEKGGNPFLHMLRSQTYRPESTGPDSLLHLIAFLRSLTLSGTMPHSLATGLHCGNSEPVLLALPIGELVTCSPSI